MERAWARAGVALTRHVAAQENSEAVTLLPQNAPGETARMSEVVWYARWHVNLG